MKLIRYLAAACAFIAVGHQPTWAQDGDDKKLPVISKKWHLVYDVERDGRSTQTFESRNQVVLSNALERMKSYSFSFSTSIQTGEVLEAYTEKKDGRRLPVPPNNFQTTTNNGRAGAAPMFSDRTSISIVFPDLAVGDTVGVVYKIVDKEPIFPGQFSMIQGFSAYGVYEDIDVTVRAPVDLKLHVESHHVQALPVREAAGIRTWQWHYQNLKPLEWNESDSGIWRVDESPSILASTFDNYEAIAKAYGDRALPKAVPTPRIRELAATIVGDAKQPIERARRLYEWVSRNMTYGGNCIGIGAVVPRDLDVVLDNKMGDCKDHATLLQALLSAADIPSEQVLINAGDMYDLAKTPVVSSVNHVINYIPEFKTYLDATAKEIPFGYLPMSANGKPVIHVGSATALARTPDLRYEQAAQKLAMQLKVDKDGSASGEMHVALKGLAAAEARAYLRELSSDNERDFVKWALNANGFKGKGKLLKGDTSGMSDTYEFSMRFDISNYLDGGTTGAFVLAPVISTPMPIMSYAGIKGRVEPNRRHTCYGFVSQENYDITLAPGLKFTSLPATAKIRSEVFDYTAKYQRTKTGVQVTREVHDKTPVSVCTAAMAAELHKQALPAAENLRTQVLYRR